MMTPIRTRLVLLAALVLALLPQARAQQSPAPAAPAAPASPAPPAQPAPPAAKPPLIDLGLRFELQPKALDILKAASAKLAAAKTLSFTAVATYESPARTGQPLAYMSLFRVALQRPNRLRVLIPGDGPPSEFYYDGKRVMAYEPQANLVAMASAPPTIDEMLKAAYDVAAIYFPFTDLIVSDPYKDLSDGLKLAFYVGQSHVVGNTTTDIVVIANDTVQAQVWIGTQDKLPRMMRATYFDEPGNYRHQVEFSNWKLNERMAPGLFTSAKAAKAPRMLFGAPQDRFPHPPATGGARP
jgi:hypothetical protein